MPCCLRKGLLRGLKNDKVVFMSSNKALRDARGLYINSSLLHYEGQDVATLPDLTDILGFPDHDMIFPNFADRVCGTRGHIAKYTLTSRKNPGTAGMR